MLRDCEFCSPRDLVLIGPDEATFLKYHLNLPV